MLRRPYPPKLAVGYQNLIFRTKPQVFIRAVPDEKIGGVFEGEALYFCGGGGGGCFSIQWMVVFCENVIL